MTDPDMPATILAAPTPADWVDAAAAHWQPLLTDHANCEKKAASTALALIFAYPEDIALGVSLARLAREELRHYEQVVRMMQRLGVPFERQQPGRYASGLRRHAASAEPRRKLDLMLMGALIEARSCERFRLLAPRLPEPLGAFYADLERAEARHHELYLAHARASAGEVDWQRRLRQLAEVEAELATSPDTVLRFHSGVVPSI
ncbi:MAG: tRNA-(ms[2]io[6]A)-hydroxylase [Steroidobacteraceae bacterium]